MLFRAAPIPRSLVSAMTESAPPGPDPIALLRARIDEIDDAILGLIEERMAIAPQLRAAKNGKSGAAAMRPAREVEIIRRLMAKSGGKLDPDLIIDVWRILMSASLRIQTDLEVCFAGAMDMVRLNDLVRRYFGHVVRLTREGDARAALARAVDNPRVIAAVPWPGNNGSGNWWPCLTENRYQSLNLVTGLPLTGEPEAALFGQGLAQEAAGGADETLAIAFDPFHKLTRVLNMSDLTGRELGRASEKLLFTMDGHVAPTDPRLVSAVRSGLDGLRVSGSYSRL